jgi:hypothetical protein
MYLSDVGKRLKDYIPSVVIELLIAKMNFLESFRYLQFIFYQLPHERPKQRCLLKALSRNKEIQVLIVDEKPARNGLNGAAKHAVTQAWVDSLMPSGLGRICENVVGRNVFLKFDGDSWKFDPVELLENANVCLKKRMHRVWAFSYLGPLTQASDPRTVHKKDWLFVEQWLCAQLLHGRRTQTPLRMKILPFKMRVCSKKVGVALFWQRII